MHPTASLGVTLGIAALALTVVTLVVLGVHRVRPAWTTRAALLGVAWLAITAGIAATGVLGRFDATPPPLAGVVLATLTVAFGLGFSRVGAALSELPLSWLVLFQAFRLPLELVMHAAAREGTMPHVMTFTGLNFDIVTGVTALLLGIALTKRDVPSGVVWSWVTLGFGLLAAIVVVSILATPMVRYFGEGEVNTWVTYPPFVWLPTILVSAALAGQIVVVRKLRRNPPRSVQ